MLILSACGGGDSRSGTAKTLTAEVLHSFDSSFAGTTGPEGNLVQGSDGNFYGTTFEGGDNNNGTVFKITPAGELTVLHSFAGGPTDGANPYNVLLIQGSDGNFYGTTSSGGRGAGTGNGTVFKLTPEGIETILYYFGGAPVDGLEPLAGLIQGSDGNFYGTTVSGGANDLGTLFKLTPAGGETVLYSFGAGTDLTRPASALIEGSDGNFYGVADVGGAASQGGLFKITPGGVETVLHFFGGSPDGSISYFLPAHLLRGSDGTFYGTTMHGGIYNRATDGYGIVFNLTPDGVETILYTFTEGSKSDGFYPLAGLIQGRDGNFYGTTTAGGANGQGTVFKLTPDGAETVLYSFTSGPADGNTPTGNLVEGSDGWLYGTTTLGGASNHGTFFRLDPN